MVLMNLQSGAQYSRYLGYNVGAMIEMGSGYDEGMPNEPPNQTG